MRRIIVAAGQLDRLSQAALACLLLSWFLTDALVASWGSLQHGVRFFDLSAIIHDPSLMFFRIPFGMRTLLFGLLCIACIAAPLLPRLYPNRWLALANFAPLLLLLACAWLLYQHTAGDLLPAPQGPQGLAGKVVGLTNRILNKGSAVVSHHISIGLGGYLGALACAALAVQGVRALRRVAPAPDRSAARVATPRP